MNESKLAEFRKDNKEKVVTENNLSIQEYRLYIESLEKYKERIKKFNTRMLDLTEKILNTILIMLKNLVEYKIEARGILKTLKARFK